MILPAKPFKLRFSIRAILVVMTLLALWCGYSMNWIRQRREVMASGVVSPHSRGRAVSAPQLLGLFGEAGYARLKVNLQFNDPEFSRTQSLFPEAVLDGILPFPMAGDE